ncbi:Holliday junction branch migration protein RuvA [candidate division KSB1 bacterium]|nr:Holliday junction branch migration protein RuvA [candidate division KSB1 bacterium]RQW01006.1 MAG: Holliday junction branch migration protein RuvA [candidate division KSB1 bacterium]
MISFIRGQLVERFPTYVIIENHGIGFEVLIPVSTFEKIGEHETNVTLLTYLHVREEALTLFGFASPEERELFKDLLSVSGIGPKLALGILSGSSVNQVYRDIAYGDENNLTKIKGLGKKTAQRLILDLKDRAAAKVEHVAPHQVLNPQMSEIVEQSILALLSLGYAKKEAENTVMRAMATRGADVSVEELIRIALSGEK